MEGYKFLETEQLPCLVLAIVQSPAYPRQYNFKPGRAWLPIQHQTAGYACNQVYLDATILTPRDWSKVNALAKQYDDSCVGQWALALEEVIEYRKSLRMYLDVDCNATFSHLAEGIYPIDATKEHLAKLTSEILPDDLNDLIDWGPDGMSAGKFAGIIGRWHLFILGENCD